MCVAAVAEGVCKVRGNDVLGRAAAYLRSIHQPEIAERQRHQSLLHSRQRDKQAAGQTDG